MKTTPSDLDQTVGTLTFEELQEQVRPALERHARRFVPGFDREDVRQELCEVLWKTQEVYDPAKGSFLNVLFQGWDNRIEWLYRQARRQQPLVTLTCTACGAVRGPGWRPQCDCGGRSFERQNNRFALLSLDQAQEDSEGESTTLVDRLGELDPALDLSDAWSDLSPERQAEYQAWLHS